MAHPVKTKRSILTAPARQRAGETSDSVERVDISRDEVADPLVGSSDRIDWIYTIGGFKAFADI